METHIVEDKTAVRMMERQATVPVKLLHQTLDYRSVSCHCSLDLTLSKHTSTHMYTRRHTGKKPQ